MSCIFNAKPEDRHCEFCLAACPERKNVSPCMTSTQYEATIEKGPDGLYCVYSEGHIGNSYFGGFGLTRTQAIADFKESVAEAFKENLTIKFTDANNQ